VSEYSPAITASRPDKCSPMLQSQYVQNTCNSGKQLICCLKRLAFECIFKISKSEKVRECSIRWIWSMRSSQFRVEQMLVYLTDWSSSIESWTENSQLLKKESQQTHKTFMTNLGGLRKADCIRLHQPGLLFEESGFLRSWSSRSSPSNCSVKDRDWGIAVLVH
jgi:hypothetical protein